MNSFRTNFRLAAVVLGLCITTACHSVRRGEPITGPMQLTSKQQHGQLTFQQRCHQCHPNGEAGLGPALNNKPAPVFLMKTQVRLGLGAMPRFDEHTILPTELDDLMDYVMALRKADATEKDKEKAARKETDKAVKKAPDKPSEKPVKKPSDKSLEKPSSQPASTNAVRRTRGSF